jgi:hypothetical protein
MAQGEVNEVVRIRLQDTGGDPMEPDRWPPARTPLYFDVTPADTPTVWETLEGLIHSLLGGQAGSKVLHKWLAMLDRTTLGFGEQPP